MDKNFQCAVNMGGRHHIFERPGSDIKKAGYLRKLKTMKKKFFVLRSTSSSGPARLEYYDSEKKFRSGSLPKRSIQLHTCFNINKKSDSRSCRFGIVLYTVHDSFTILTECETEQDAWLDVMLEYQNEYLPEGDLGKEHYEHVWQVTMQPRGLGQGKGLKGNYRMCLNSTTISLFKVNANQSQFSIQLVTIRAVGHNDNSFWLELGNYAATGPGQFWFLVEDAAVAKDMHTTIIQYMASVKDFFDKDQQFAFSKKVIHSGFLDGFGGLHQPYGESRKSYSSYGTHPHDASMDFTMDYSTKQSDTLNDLSHPLCSGDFDGELSCYFDNSLPDHSSILGHHPHPVGKHGYNFPELLYPTHLPTVKEGGSGEGYLLSEQTSSETSSTDFPRPEPATCLLSDEPVGLSPRTYSLGSRPTKKFQGFTDASSRKVAGGEISRATSAPHIPKGRKERERKMDSPTPAPSPLSMSMKSDDSDSVIEYGPIRPRTASDSFNYRSRTSSFGKLQQNCRPRSSSYGQGKRPTINISKLKLEKAMFSGNASQRTSRESSLQSSFESLRVSSESLRRPSLELRQPRGTYSSEQNDHRNTPSPQMKNLQSDSDSYNDQGTVSQKSSHFIRTESCSSGRPPDNMSRKPDHPFDHSRSVASTGSGGCSEDVYVNIDFSSQSASNNDNKPAAPHGQPSRVEGQRYVNVDMGIRNRKSHGGRSLSVENVDTYFISELPFTANTPRTGSVGSKDKQMLRPESARQPTPISVSSSEPLHPGLSSSVQSSSVPLHPGLSSSVQSSSVPLHSGLSSSVQPSSVPLHPGLSAVQSSSVPLHPGLSSVQSSSDTVNQQSLPIASLSSHSFGGSDCMRRPPCVPSNEKHGMPDFRQKSGSTGSRPNTMRTSLGISGREQSLPGAVAVSMRKSSLPRFYDDETAGEYIEFPFPGSRTGSLGIAQSGNTESNISQSDITQSGKESRIAQSEITQSDIPQSGTSHFCPPYAHSNENDQAASSEDVASVNSNTASSPSPSSSSSPCRFTSHSTTSSTKDEGSYVLYNPAFPTVPPQQGPTRLHCHCRYDQKKRQTTDLSSTSPKTDTVEYGPEYVGFQPRSVQSTKREHVDDEHAECKLSSASSVVPSSGHDGASTQDSNGYVEYSPGSVSCDVFKNVTPDSAFSYVPTYKGSRTVGLAKLKQQRPSSNMSSSARKYVPKPVTTKKDLVNSHGSNISGSPCDTDPRPCLSLPFTVQTFRSYFQPIKTQSLDMIDSTEHRHLSSSAEVNGLPPTGLGAKHHLSRCDNACSEPSADCEGTFCKENTPSSNLSFSTASGRNKCQQSCADHTSNIAAETSSVSSCESWDMLTCDKNTASLAKSLKSTATSRNAKLPRRSLGDIRSVTNTNSRASENRSPTNTFKISALDDMQISVKAGIRRSLTDYDFMEAT